MGQGSQRDAAQAMLRRIAIAGRTKLRQEGMTDAEIDAVINEAVARLNATHDIGPKASPRAA